LVAFEKLEALRYITTGVLRPGGTVLVGEMSIPPLSVSSGDDVYPGDDEVKRVIGVVADDVRFIPSLSLAEEAGNVRAHNIVVLGTLSTCVEQVPPEIWLDVIAARVPERYIEVNKRAFQMGREAG
jgi:indolepyruvate ferredoxin oxidoreductase beta subunit